MKVFLKICGIIVACLVLLLIVLRVTGFNPIGDTPGKGNYPGLWLSGHLVTTPVTDWSFTTQYKTDKVQTRTPYLIPHSVTTSSLFYKGQLYLTSNFPAGRPFPQGKSWTANVVRDPHVRVKFGDNLYDCTAYPVTDPAEQATLLQALAEKNHQQTVTNAATMHFFHVLPESNSYASR